MNMGAKWFRRGRIEERVQVTNGNAWFDSVTKL